MKDYIEEKKIKYKQKKTSIYTTGILNDRIPILNIDTPPHEPIIIKIKYGSSNTQPLYARINMLNLKKYCKLLGFKKEHNSETYVRNSYNVNGITKVKDILTYEQL